MKVFRVTYLTQGTISIEVNATNALAAGDKADDIIKLPEIDLDIEGGITIDDIRERLSVEEVMEELE